jgi:hypothetical protein
MNYQFDPDKCASLIRGTLAIHQKKQIRFANEIGIHKTIFNMFLNRKLNLFPDQIETALDALGIRKQAEKICRLNNGNLNNMVGASNSEKMLPPQV